MAGRMNGGEVQVQGNEDRRKHERIESVWQPLERTTFKVNVDAAFNLTTREEVIGMIGRDYE
jgi:hypothetical protein